MRTHNPMSKILARAFHSIWLMLPLMVQAQNLQNFEPKPGQNGIVVSSSSKTLDAGHLVPSLTLSFGDQPVVSRDPNANVNGVYVDRQTGLDLGVVWGVMDGFEIGLTMPMGDVRGQMLNESDKEGIAVGDLRLSTKVNLIGAGRRGFGLALLLNATAPTGSDDQLYGSRGATMSPGIVGDLRLRDIHLIANISARFRTETQAFENLEIGHEAVYSGGAIIDLDWPGLAMVAEVFGSMPLQPSLVDDASFPVEALLGLRFEAFGAHFTIGSGFGLNPDRAVPNHRLLFSMSYDHWTKSDAPIQEPATESDTPQTISSDNAVTAQLDPGPNQDEDENTVPATRSNQTGVTPSTVNGPLDGETKQAISPPSKDAEETPSQTDKPSDLNPAIQPDACEAPNSEDGGTQTKSSPEPTAATATQTMTHGTPSNEGDEPEKDEKQVATALEAWPAQAAQPDPKIASAKKSEAPTQSDGDRAPETAPEDNAQPKGPATNKAEEIEQVTVDKPNSVQESQQPEGVEETIPKPVSVDNSDADSKETRETATTAETKNTETQTDMAPKADVSDTIMPGLKTASTSGSQEDVLPEKTEIASDLDGDGVPDKDDGCMNDPEDSDGFEDEDGCPDTDNDEDGVPDNEDKCPNGEAGPSAQTGCQSVSDKSTEPPQERPEPEPVEPPKSKPTPVGDDGRVEYKGQIRFVPASPRLTSASKTLLKEIAGNIDKIGPNQVLSVEAYSFVMTTPKQNVRISGERGLAVRDALIASGVEPNKIVHVGLGYGDKDRRKNAVGDGLIVLRMGPKTKAPYAVETIALARSDKLSFNFELGRAVQEGDVEVNLDGPNVIMIRLRGAQVERRWVELKDSLIKRTLLHPSSEVIPAAILRVRLNKAVPPELLDKAYFEASGTSVKVSFRRW